MTATPPAEAARLAAEEFLAALGCAVTRRDDGTLLVTGDINLARRGLSALPDLSMVEVTGNFDCAQNALSSLKGAPYAVQGDVHCNNNKLTTLVGGPRIVGGDYLAFFNTLVTLRGAPASVGKSFSCRSNHLRNLLHGPAAVGAAYDCSENPQLADLRGAPADVPVNFRATGGALEDLAGGPRRCGRDYDVRGNALAHLEDAPETFGTFHTDFGSYTDAKDIPDDLRKSPHTQRREAAEAFHAAAALQKDITPAAPLNVRKRLRRPSPA